MAATVPAEARRGEHMTAIVVDARTGRTLYESNADAPHYPASLTKMMTLYLTFEALASGRIAKTTPVVFSGYAASMPPTRLGVKAGQAITVETAIYALVTRSANDAATALGELLGGSIPNFARMMTAKAHSLGMAHTQFRNANGLPDPSQYTTARDMAVLGIALRRNFPQYYGYFATRSFVYGRHRIANHNHLLGRVAGVDGIKTGYTRASGFNIVTSVKLDGRRIVGVVMGGRTSRSRDAQMTALIRKYLPRASTGGGELVAEREQKIPSKIKVVAAALPHEDAPTPDRRPRSRPKLPEVMALAETASSPAAQKINEIVDPVSTASTEEKPAAKRAEGWVIQVASTASEADARAFLARTSREAPKVLADASPFTVAFEKNGVTYYRARYSGFASKSEAWDTCGALRKRKIACFAVTQ